MSVNKTINFIKKLVRYISLEGHMHKINGCWFI